MAQSSANCVETVRSFICLLIILVSRTVNCRMISCLETSSVTDSPMRVSPPWVKWYRIALHFSNTDVMMVVVLLMMDHCAVVSDFVVLFFFLSFLTVKDT